MIQGKCKYCNSPSEKWRKNICSRHRGQLVRHGKILSITRMDRHKYYFKSNYVEIAIRNCGNDEIARVKIDIDDFDKVMRHRWHLRRDGYVYSPSAKTSMHRFIMNAREGEIIDHINLGKENKLDNRKSNLRFVNAAQNAIHSLKPNTNTSGLKGVTWKMDKKRWKAYVKINQKQIHIGYFKNKIDAAIARDKFVKNFYGEYASTNIGMGLISAIR